MGVPRAARFADGRMEAARGRGDGELVFNGERVSVLQDRRCSGGWVHDSVNVLNTTGLCTQNGCR